MCVAPNIGAMPLRPSVRDAVRRHWSDRLDCSPVAFETAGVTLVDGPSDRAVRLLRRGRATVVAAPTELHDVLRTVTGDVAERPLSDAAVVVDDAIAGTDTAVGSVRGPAVCCYVDAAGFEPADTDARLLAGSDEAEFEALRDRLPEAEWTRASPTFRPGRTAGLFADGDLVATATLDEGAFPDVGVVVAPGFRDEGAGSAVVSRVLEAAFDDDATVVPCYRTPRSLPASLSLAAGLGFERWASEVVLVLE